MKKRKKINFNKFKKNVRGLDITDLVFIKLMAFSFALFVVGFSPWFVKKITSVSWAWFLGATILFSIRPIKKLYFS
ncbi:MAG: hypothetical protein OQK82_07225 [Candidatus Pacearchaeota archaeon]|nr:hypothetical protein [Candidatus Pacearchaeota archaeon]